MRVRPPPLLLLAALPLLLGCSAQGSVSIATPEAGEFGFTATGVRLVEEE